MSGGDFYGPDQIRELKARVNLVELVGSYTAIRQQGGRAVCCCPLPGHAEKTPSCTVYEDGHFHCFGCNRNGDAISLVQEREGCDFRDAVEFLARRIGMDLKPVRGGKTDGPTRVDRERYLAAMLFAVRFYHQQLRSPAGAGGLAYLKSRGFTDDTLDQFHVGWAAGRSALTNEAKAHGHAFEDLRAVGLVNDGSGWSNDFFFNRVTIPVCDRHGQPIAISARKMPDSEGPKYVNSIVTRIYRKESVVFNLHRAREAARIYGRILVVEGAADVLASTQAGVAEIVACCGTSITIDHLRIMQQTVGDGKIILVMNNDSAGIKAAIATVRKAIPAGIDVHVAGLPAKDVANLLLENAA